MKRFVEKREKGLHMKICMDCQVLMLQKFGGVSRYFYNIKRRLSTNSETEIVMPGVFCKNEYFGYEYKKLKKTNSFFMLTLYRFINYAYNALYLLCNRIDIYHPTYYSKHLFLLKGKAKTVITVHDMIPEIYGDLYPNTKKACKQKRFYIENADSIIAVSEKTREDICVFYPDLPKEKIRVIHHGAPQNTIVTPVDGIPQKYVLFVGDRKNYKNFSTFCHAMNYLMNIDIELYAVCAGGGSFLEEEQEKITFLDRFIQKDCSDGELNYLYKNAICFVFPSLYEGFGIPILEAFSNNCPCVLSKSSCFPEVAGDAAVYFESNSVEDLVKKILFFKGNKREREEYIKKGKKRLELFDWDKSAYETMSVYKELCK